jgi:hypothetical protein
MTPPTERPRFQGSDIAVAFSPCYPCLPWFGFFVFSSYCLLTTGYFFLHMFRGLHSVSYAVYCLLSTFALTTPRSIRGRQPWDQGRTRLLRFGPWIAG